MIEPAVAGVIGWPIAHSKSPLIHRFWLHKLGIDGDYSRFPVAPEQLGHFVRALPAIGLRGVNVTIPHKVAVIAHLDAVDETARQVGAVNCITLQPDGRTLGSNTDVDGICGPLSGHDMAGRDMIILGAGGAARAAIAAARQLQAAHVWLVARDREKAAALLAAAAQPGTVVSWGDPLPETPQAGLLFNATSLGMKGQPVLDIGLTGLPPDAVVFDAVYSPLDTHLLRNARAAGLATIDGLSMLIGQAARAFQRFFAAEAPRQHDDELRELLTR